MLACARSSASGCKEVVFAGKFERPRGRVKVRPDWGGIAFLVRYLGVLRRSDDGLHRAFADLMSRHGFRVVSPLDANPDLAARRGCVTASSRPRRKKPRSPRRSSLAKKHGASDEGQAVVVAEWQVIIAREGRAGTDAMLGASLGGASDQGAILVKAMTPNQLVTIDPPAIGESTVDQRGEGGTCRHPGRGGLQRHRR